MGSEYDDFDRFGELFELIIVNDVRKEIYSYGSAAKVGDIVSNVSDCNHIQVAHASKGSLIIICDRKEGLL